MTKPRLKDFLLLAAYSIANTFFSLSILNIITNALSHKAGTFSIHTAVLFFMLIIGAYLLNIAFQNRVISFSLTLVYNNEVTVLKILHGISLRKLEQYGTERFYNILEDLRVFVFLPSMLTNTINSFFMILVCLGYLFWISAVASSIVLGLIITIAGLYLFINKKLAGKYQLLRKYNEHYYKYIDDSIRGFKELKASSVRSSNLFHKYLYPNRMDAKKVDARLSLTYASINLISQYGIYVLLGVVLFLLSFANLFGQNGIATYVVTLLFISGPINNLISMQGFYTKALVANKRVKTFFYDFKPEESAGGNGRGRQGFSSLKLDGVSFKYEGPGPNHAFALDNIHFSLHRGEVVFIVGGNGSGKSTFINMLTGLYKPSSGHILVNNEVVDTSGPDYKDLFSVVFTDNHLFSRNYDNYSLESNPAYAELLKIMQLDQVVSDDSEDSARRRFSKGQGKRMSLIFSLLEDHPILILDEWAADQDPHFRKYFYQKLLPELKKKGLSVIAVTHDETYFSAADRIVKFDYGRIVKDNQPALSTI